jgi:transmembrane 9 superfamily protein 3
MRFNLIELLAVLLFLSVSSFAKDHVYQDEQIVPLYVNKIGPYANPSESYDYYSLPFCKPPDVQHAHHHSLGEKLEGDVKKTSAYEIRFNGIYFLAILLC